MLSLVLALISTASFVGMMIALIVAIRLSERCEKLERDCRLLLDIIRSDDVPPPEIPSTLWKKSRANGGVHITRDSGEEHLGRS
jgi:hypothetical protein